MTTTEEEQSSLKRLEETIPELFQCAVVRQMGIDLFTMIHSGTLCIQRKVTKFPRFWCLVFRAQFQDFLSAFWRSCFAMQLALVSMITISPTLSLSVFSLQRTRLFRTCGELWRTRGELWLYFEMQRRLDLWSFSWSSWRSREAQK